MGTLAQRCASSPTAACCPRKPALRPREVAPLAGLLKALGDPTRLEIVALLAAASGPLCACHVESRFRLSQPTVSHHLRVLRDAGIVSAERRGTWMHYALERAALQPVLELRRLLGP